MKRESLILVVSLSLTLFILGMCVSVYIAPYFSLAFISILFVILLFMLTERWTTHNASEFENRFWSFVALLLSSAFLLISDSPFYLKAKYPVSCFVIIILFTYIIHNYDRHLRRLVLNRIPDLRRNQSSFYCGLKEDRNKAREAALEKLCRLDMLVSQIDPVWLSSAFKIPFYIMKIESDIINIFTEASPYELNAIIKERALGLIFYKVKDHRLFNTYHRTKLLNLLAVERVLETSVASRALILHGLQQMKLSAHEKSEDWAKNIIIKTTGDDLSELKTLMDAKGDFNSMHKLIYVDIRNTKIKQEILDHISREARVQIAHMALGTRIAKRRQQFAWRKILSDVDDTLSCSGNSYPAGIDDSYPRKVIYPGVLAFYRELDLGTGRGETDVWDSKQRVGNLVFLSARPHVYKDLSENQTYKKFRSLLDSNRLHTSPSLLTGSLDTGSQFIVEGSLEPLAKKKFENFIEYLALYPEFRCIFIGDNGQGDVRASELLMEHPQYGSNLDRVYIHEVQPIGKTHAMKCITKSRQCPRIFYFRNYMDAALDAFRHGLIRISGLRRIVIEALREFEAIPEVAWKTGGVRGGFRTREIRRMELRQSVVRANEQLSKFGLEPVPLPRVPAQFPPGTPVITPYGKGIVQRFRAGDGIYETLILWNGCAENPYTRAYLYPLSLIALSGMPSHDRSPSAQLVSIENIPYTRGSRTSVIQSDRATVVSATLTAKSRVWTAYGLGRVVRQRVLDKIASIEVALDWGAHAFLEPHCVIILALKSAQSPQSIKSPLSRNSSPKTSTTKQTQSPLSSIPSLALPSAISRPPPALSGGIGGISLLSGRGNVSAGTGLQPDTTHLQRRLSEIDTDLARDSRRWGWYWPSPSPIPIPSQSAPKSTPPGLPPLPGRSQSQSSSQDTAGQVQDTYLGLSGALGALGTVAAGAQYSVSAAASTGSMEHKPEPEPGGAQEGMPDNCSVNQLDDNPTLITASSLSPLGTAASILSHT